MQVIAIGPRDITNSNPRILDYRILDYLKNRLPAGKICATIRVSQNDI